MVLEVSRLYRNSSILETEHHATDEIGAQRHDVSRVERIERRLIRMTIGIVGPHADQRNSWMHRVEKVRCRARDASMMANFQDIRGQKFRRVLEEPRFFRRFSVARKERVISADANGQYGACEIGIMEMRRPG